MNRLNNQGLNLIDYKKEFNYPHAIIVKNALLLALNKLVDDNRIDLETLDKIQDDSIDLQSFSRFLLSRAEYIKNEQELFFEFEKVRQKVDDYMEQIGFMSSLKTESIVKDNIIMISKKFVLSKSFLIIYFGITDEQYMQLVKKKGFIEKFAVLRLNKICKEIRNEVPQDRFITQKQSQVIFDKNTSEFCIYYQYCINVDFIEKDSNLSIVINKIKSIDETAQVLYEQKIGISQYPSMIQQSAAYIPIDKNSYAVTPESLIEDKPSEENNETLIKEFNSEPEEIEEMDETESQLINNELIEENIDEEQINSNSSVETNTYFEANEDNKEDVITEEDDINPLPEDELLNNDTLLESQSEEEAMTFIENDFVSVEPSIEEIKEMEDTLGNPLNDNDTNSSDLDEFGLGNIEFEPLPEDDISTELEESIDKATYEKENVKPERSNKRNYNNKNKGDYTQPKKQPKQKTFFYEKGKKEPGQIKEDNS